MYIFMSQSDLNLRLPCNPDMAPIDFAPDDASQSGSRIKSV